MYYSKNNIFRHGIGRKLLIWVVIFSSIITFFATLAQLYFEYNQEVSSINKRIKEIEKSYLTPISASLWNLDIDQLKLLIDGIMYLPDMQAIEIREINISTLNPLLLKNGQPLDRHKISRSFDIIYDNQNKPTLIGQLDIQVTLLNIYDRLIYRTIIILSTQAIKTFLVSIFILYIFHWVVTRHLIFISEQVENFDVHKPDKKLTLKREVKQNQDELDKVVSAFNDRHYRLAKSYKELEKINAELKLDISARRLAEQKIITLNQELDERVQHRTIQLIAANKELNAFCHSVSHNLRVPLQWTKQPCNMLIQEYSNILDERGIKLATQINLGLIELDEIIDSFLRLSRTTSGEILNESIDISALTEQVIQRIQHEDQQHSVKTNIQPNLSLDADYRLVEILLFNLLHNSWKYTKHTINPFIEFGEKEINKKPYFFIRDNGAGFNSKNARNLFTPFQRFHTKDQFEGIGIGLSSVYRIISRHGGNIWLESEVNQGTTVYFSFSDHQDKKLL